MDQRRKTYLAVAVAALGYFVDVFDLVLFSVVRVRSLQDLGLSGSELFSRGVDLLNMQMAGMLVGGVLWGIWGDRRGRLAVLFGSILLYSLANIANGMVQTTEQYGWLRFIAGVGLAGELGAGITLVSEILPKESRGYATTLVATVGVSGAIAAGFLGQMIDWRTCYIVGGILGLALLVARVAVSESGMFERAKTSNVSRGDFLALFRSRKLFVRYASCILVGLPIWYVVGILVTFSPEFGDALQVSERPTAGSAILYSYIGFVAGDLASGVISQLLRSRKRALRIFLCLTALACIFYLQAHGVSLNTLYLLCVFLGFAAGYWTVFVTAAAEQFGTNIRATVTTTAPNFVRGATVPITFLFRYLEGEIGIIQSAFVVGALTITIAAFALWSLEESFGRDLDFTESV